MKACLFPGQASQYLGMGEGLFDQFPTETAAASEVLGYNIKTLCLEDPEDQLDETQFTQVAVYVVSALSYMKKIQAGDTPPDYVLGHSVGEYAALFAAGAFSSEHDPKGFITGLELVKHRGQLMSEITGGAMAAVMHKEPIVETIVKGVFKRYSLTELDVANYNTPKQLVISGLERHIEDAEDYFDEAGADYYILPVSGAFHSHYMAPVASRFAAVVEAIDTSPLTIPVIANLTARPYGENTVTQCLVGQIQHPVLWEESIRYLLEQGVDKFEEVCDGEKLIKMIDAIEDNS